MRNTLLWFPKTLLLSHYVLIMNMIYPRSAQAEIDRKIDAMRRRIFGDD